MPVPANETQKQRRARLARNAARNEKRAARKAAERIEQRTAEAATSDDEGEANFETLIKLEAARQSDEKLASAKKSLASHAGAKTIRAARENLSEAFDFLGGVPALVVWGRQNRTEFYRLWARLIPKEAAEESTKAPLEDLLQKLAERENSTVAQAALEIGAQALEEGRAGAQAEDALAAPVTKYEVN